MPDGVEIIGSPDDVIWGSDGVYESATIVKVGDKEVTGSEREIKDNNGNTAVLVLFDERNNCRVTCLGQASVTPPTRGESATIAGVLCIVKRVVEHWKNEQEQEFEVEATRYVANSLPAA